MAQIEGDCGRTIPATGKQIARGTAWLMLFKLTDRGLGFASTLILARLLTPADFGLVAMATAVVALTELMGAFGFDTALIQRQDANRSHYDTAWTFNVIFGLAIGLLVLALALPAASFYREQRLAEILPVLALGALIAGFENIGTVAFRKELNFRAEFRFLLAKRMAAFLVTVGLAVAFRTYWALVAGIVTAKVAGVLISYRLHPYRPRFDLSARADLLHFSKWLLFSNLLQFLQSRSTDFILGRTVGTHGLGIYSLALDIATLPSTELIAPINRAVYPAYSRLSHHLDELITRFKEVFGLIALLAMPVAFGLFSIAEPAVRVLLGPNWLEAVPIIRILAISGLIGALQSNLCVVILALGRPKANTLLSAGLMTLSLPTVVIASLQYGAVGAAAAHAATGILGFIGIVVVFTNATGLSVRHLLSTVWRPILAALAMAALVVHIDSLILETSPSLPTILRLFVLIALGVCVYFVGILAAWLGSGRPMGPERTLFNIALARLERRKGQQGV